MYNISSTKDTASQGSLAHRQCALAGCHTLHRLPLHLQVVKILPHTGSRRGLLAPAALPRGLVGPPWEGCRHDAAAVAAAAGRL